MVVIALPSVVLGGMEVTENTDGRSIPNRRRLSIPVKPVGKHSGEDMYLSLGKAEHVKSIAVI